MWLVFLERNDDKKICSHIKDNCYLIDEIMIVLDCIIILELFLFRYECTAILVWSVWGPLRPV